MVVYYHCKQCNAELGTVSSREAMDYDLGFSVLNQEEKKEVLETDEQGNLHVHALCDTCYEMSQASPHVHEQDHWYH
ncbi:anti-sigma-F factor Fin [Geomicrobium sp. JCM 19055]|uniref:anti-sigma-F factor Fin n=1 Tax=Geomicrobium sp. JCM 19055 TaxID=1460649 RepID=UPI00045EDAFD|nr:anti-sigma-F factor Fin [Geomicrobium sp. JCM 19055]GAK01400.1 hypothetical protein JCM19055_4560 [Geomicrobium sp. JCM 19055]